MKTFRELLKPAAVGAKAAAFYPALKLGKRVVWKGAMVYRKRDFGNDARQMAVDDAETVLHCDPGSLMAEELQQLVEQHG